MNELKESTVKTDINVDVHTGALILIDMLYAQKLINKKTYDNIQAKYNPKNENKIQICG